METNLPETLHRIQNENAGPFNLQRRRGAERKEIRGRIWYVHGIFFCIIQFSLFLRLFVANAFPASRFQH